MWPPIAQVVDAEERDVGIAAELPHGSGGLLRDRQLEECHVHDVAGWVTASTA